MRKLRLKFYKQLAYAHTAYTVWGQDLSLYLLILEGTLLITTYIITIPTPFFPHQNLMSYQHHHE